MGRTTGISYDNELLLKNCNDFFQSVFNKLNIKIIRTNELVFLEGSKFARFPSCINPNIEHIYNGPYVRAVNHVNNTDLVNDIIESLKIFPDSEDLNFLIYFLTHDKDGQNNIIRKMIHKRLPINKLMISLVKLQ